MSDILKKMWEKIISNDFYKENEWEIWGNIIDEKK